MNLQKLLQRIKSKRTIAQVWLFYSAVMLLSPCTFWLNGRIRLKRRRWSLSQFYNRPELDQGTGICRWKTKGMPCSWQLASLIRWSTWKFYTPNGLNKLPFTLLRFLCINLSFWHSKTHWAVIVIEWRTALSHRLAFYCHFLLKLTFTISPRYPTGRLVARFCTSLFRHTPRTTPLLTILRLLLRYDDPI